MENNPVAKDKCLIKLADYVNIFLHSKGIDTVFYLAGGGMMHLLDSLGSSQLNPVSLLHEQAVAIACEAYATTKGSPGAAFVTTGPGGTNAITGVLAAYIDSAPCFFVSGQVKTTDLKSRYGVRSLGSQEADIVALVSNITKYSFMVTDPNTIRYHLERAWYEMTTGRKGPVWIDIPLDVQSAQVNPNTLPGYTVQYSPQDIDVMPIINALNNAKRPVIIAGNGLANCKQTFNELIDLLQIPVIPTWKAVTLIANTHPLYAGRSGGMGDRPGNLTVQNADFILSLGSRLDFSITGYDRSQWGRKAKKIIVEIDPAEIAKLEEITNLVSINADVSLICSALLAHCDKLYLKDITEWKEKIVKWQQRYPIITPERYISSSGNLTTYGFVDTLCRHLPEGAYVASCNAGTTAEIFFQSCTVKPNQIIHASHGLGSMGFEIPNAIGMCIANDQKQVVCIAGDGGIQLNIQELAVIGGRNLPIAIFVINNQGYASIRNMQNNHFDGRYIGCDFSSGLFLPKLEDLARAYGLQYLYVNGIDELEDMIIQALSTNSPILCEVFVDEECLIVPRTATQIMPDGSLQSSPLENQFPFLSEDEIKMNLL